MVEPSFYVGGLLFEMSSPPEPFAEEFPDWCQYVLFSDPSREHKVSMFVPEDDRYITDADEVLGWIYRMAPITTFVGAVTVIGSEE